MLRAKAMGNLAILNTTYNLKLLVIFMNTFVETIQIHHWKPITARFLMNNLN